MRQWEPLCYFEQVSKCSKEKKIKKVVHEFGIEYVCVSIVTV